MIKTQFLVPEYYYKESRDFQLFGRLYDVVFNYLKTEIDLIRSFPANNTQSTTFLELILRTLGLNLKRNYEINQLRDLVTVWTKIIRNKGSLNAIETLVKTILRSDGNSNDYIITLLTPQNSGTEVPTIVIQMKELVSSQESSLLEECLNYILPIGVSFYIQDVSIINTQNPGKIAVQEHTSTKKYDRFSSARFAKIAGTKIPETSYSSNPDAYTGTFKEELPDSMIQGSIKGGTVTKYKEDKEGD